MSRRQRRYERKSQAWRAQSGLRAPECKTWSFFSRDTCRECRKQRNVKHDEHINEWSQTVAWPQQGGGSSGDVAFPMKKPKGAAQALALARQQLTQAKASALPEACIRILENEVQKDEAAMKQAQPWGQEMDQARARFRRAVESGEKVMLQKALENVEQAQQEVMQAQPVPQVNMSLVKIFGSLDINRRNMWNPYAGPPPENLVHAIQESRQMLTCTPDKIPSCGIWTAKKPRRWRTSRRHMLQAGRQSTMSRARKAATGHTHTINTTAEEDAHRSARGCGAGWCQSSQAQRLSTRAMLNPRDTELLALSQRTGKFLRFCIASLRFVAWVCSSTDPERHWPACFDQTCRYPREGPLTTLDSPDVPELSLTPTQEIRTCVIQGCA